MIFAAILLVFRYILCIYKKENIVDQIKKIYSQKLNTCVDEIYVRFEKSINLGNIKSKINNGKNMIDVKMLERGFLSNDNNINNVMKELNKRDICKDFDCSFENRKI
jgi:hypothetical protein